MCRAAKRCPVGSALLTASLAVGAVLAWRAWKLPHAGDDWVALEPSRPQG